MKRRLQHERELRAMADGYERQITNGQFGQLNIVAQEHRNFHEREHELYEAAIERATATLSTHLAAIETELDRVRDESQHWLPVARYEREHKLLSDRIDVQLGAISEKVSVEERVTLRQGVQDEMLERIKQNNRWLIGLAVAVALSLFTSALHVIGVL